MITQLQQFNCFNRSGANATPKCVCPEAKGGGPTTDLHCSGLVTHSGEILTNDKSHKKKMKRLPPKMT